MKRYLLYGALALSMISTAYAANDHRMVSLSDMTDAEFNEIETLPHYEQTMTCMFEALQLYKMTYPLMNISRGPKENAYVEWNLPDYPEGTMRMSLEQGEFLNWEADHIICSPNYSGAVVVTTNTYGFETKICDPVYLPGCLENYKKPRKHKFYNFGD